MGKSYQVSISCDRSILERSIGVDLDLLVLKVDINEFKFYLWALDATNHKTRILLGSFCHVPNAQSADIVLTAVWDQNGVKVPQTNRAAILVDLLKFPLCWVVNHIFDILLWDLGLDADFISLADLVSFATRMRDRILLLKNFIHLAIILIRLSH